ncbi:hypothetical protein BDB00DRAFT_788287 [Zychaea mexicana]|uniref:uncharacterized protein n=1 Tax=Zychaea mexicana TaxID=64656 RepID=UPI0022FDBD22|nr:uncharacterized protein BDB00DRAFT_788287 [Zychaea mexicana]KAI9493060.1 hypothetical protein BDB00DRAFT_788287 [Zychaea mexicana]
MADVSLLLLELYRSYLFTASAFRIQYCTRVIVGTTWDPPFVSCTRATQESHVAVASSSSPSTSFALPTTAITTADTPSTSTASPFSVPDPSPSSSLSTQQQQPRTTRKRKNSGYAPSSR